MKIANENLRGGESSPFCRRSLFHLFETGYCRWHRRRRRGLQRDFSPKAIVAQIEDVSRPPCRGMDPFRIETLWRNVHGRGYSQRPDITLMGVLSSIEMALWDIVGKSVGKPIYELLGGRCMKRLRSYTYLYPAFEKGEHAYSPSKVYSDPDAGWRRALHYVA